MSERWQNQEEAFQFALGRRSCLLDMDMGTGKTRVAIDTTMAREDAKRILVVCPKAVIPVWRTNLQKFVSEDLWDCWDDTRGTIKNKVNKLQEWMNQSEKRQIIVVNYDIVWRAPLGDFLLKAGLDVVILDESHRAKAAGSKVSKYLAMLGKRVKYKMCLSGTPMANSPLDVYGQFRFLDPTIFGTNHNQFLQEYAVMGGPERRFVVGYKNQKQLNEKFKSITYSCKMSDISDRLKLPPLLPPVQVNVQLPPKDMVVAEELSNEFIAECSGGVVVVKNALGKILRLQQIAAGFCVIQEHPLAPAEVVEMNTAKQSALYDLLEDISPKASVVVFCVFRHDIDVVGVSARKAKRDVFEITGEHNQLEEWKKSEGGVLAVQIQAGAEGIDMTNSHHAIYFSLPHSLALYNQSKARLYRPNQSQPVSFCHIIAEGTIDEAIYESLIHKEDIIESIKNGTFDFGTIKH